MGLAEKPSDDMMKKLVKRIPTDVVTMYMAARGVLVLFQDQTQKLYAEWLVFLVGLVGTVVVRYLQNKKEIEKHKNNPEYGKITGLQYCFMAGTFFVWAWAVGSPLGYLAFDPAVPTLAVVMWTFILVIFPVGGEEEKDLITVSRLISLIESGEIEQTDVFQSEVERIAKKVPKKKDDIRAMIEQSDRWVGEAAI